MVVWLDVLMVENFLVNFFLLTVTMSTLKKRSSLLRLFIASLVGSSYIITMVVPQLNMLTKTPFKIIVAVVMIIIVNNEKEFIPIAKQTIIFILYSMLLAGLSFYLAISSGDPVNISNTVYKFTGKNLLLSIMVIYIVIHRVVIYVKERKCFETFIYNIDICFKEQKKSIRAFLDTGNELREPATNLPVIIVEKDVFKDLNLKEYNTYCIPYSVISGSTGRLIGVKPDYITIELNGNVIEQNVIVAFCDKKLSKHNDYKGLLSIGIIN